MGGVDLTYESFFKTLFYWNTADVGDLGSILGLGRCPGEGKGYTLQYSGLKNSMDCIVHGVTKNWTQRSDFYTHS